MCLLAKIVLITAMLTELVGAEMELNEVAGLTKLPKKDGKRQGHKLK